MNVNRNTLNFSSLPAVIQEMIEGSSKAAAVIDELIDKWGENNALAILIMLDDMNIRGVQIASLYKICNQDIDKFYEKALTMTEDDVEKVNYESYTVCKYKAVYNGSKEDRDINPDNYVFTDEERNNIRDLKSKDRALSMLENSSKTNIESVTLIQDDRDLYPTITSKEALEIINNNGFKCGYEKNYESDDGKSITYRVFYNNIGDIICTNSLNEPDIFLWGECKLNVIRRASNRDYHLTGCNSYKNISGIVGYNIDLKEKPFKMYNKIVDRNNKLLKKIEYNYFNNNLIPIIRSNKGIQYIQDNREYDNIVIANIYDLLTFKETFYDLDDGLKSIYKVLVTYAEEKAYDELIYQLNTDDGVDVCLKLQEDLGIMLDSEKMLSAKDRFLRAGKRHFNIPGSKFLSGKFTQDPKDKIISERIIKIAEKKALPI